MMHADSMTDHGLINFIIDVREGLRLHDAGEGKAFIVDYHTREPDRPRNMAALDEAERLLRAGEREAGIAKLYEAYGRKRES